MIKALIAILLFIVLASLKKYLDPHDEAFSKKPYTRKITIHELALRHMRSVIAKKLGMFDVVILYENHIPKYGWSHVETVGDKQYLVFGRPVTPQENQKVKALSRRWKQIREDLKKYD